jgi:hypothetical protein
MTARRPFSEMVRETGGAHAANIFCSGVPGGKRLGAVLAVVNSMRQLPRLKSCGYFPQPT